MDDSVIRNVSKHNEQILTDALAYPTFNCLAFIPHTNKTFRVHIGKDTLGLDSIAFFNEDGTSYWAYSWSGLSKDSIIETVLGTLKKERLRLELNLGAIYTSKNVIYYMPALKA